MIFTHGAVNSHTSSVETQQTTSRSYITHVLSHSGFTCYILSLSEGEPEHKAKKQQLPKMSANTAPIGHDEPTNMHVFS